MQKTTQFNLKSNPEFKIETLEFKTLPLEFETLEFKN